MGKHGIKPGMGPTVFDSSERRFRLHVQRDSVPKHLPETHTSGPITVEPLGATEEVDGDSLRGLLEVHCLPDKRRFDPPLLFDFLVDGGDKNNPIIDEFGRIRYEVRK